MTGNIQGKIINITGTPLSNVLVYYSVYLNIHDTNYTVISTMTDINGNYSFSNLTPLDYVITSKKQGHSRETKVVTVTDNTITTQDYILSTYTNATISQISGNIYISNGYATLNEIKTFLNDINAIEEISPKVWLLKKWLIVNSTATVYIDDNDVTELRLLSMDTGSVVDIKVQGYLTINNTTIKSWNTTLNSVAPITDTNRSQIYLEGELSGIEIINSELLELGALNDYPFLEWIGKKSFIIDNSNIKLARSGIEVYGSYVIEKGFIRNVIGLSSITSNAIYNVIYADSTYGYSFTINGSTNVLVKNVTTGLTAGHNAFECNNIINSLIYGCTVTNYGHNGFQFSSNGSNPTHHSMFKNCLAYSAKGGTGGSAGYYCTWNLIAGSEPHDLVIEDCIAHDFRLSENGIGIDKVTNLTIRRYSSWNIANIDIDIQNSTNVIIVDSTLSGIGSRPYGSTGTKSINSYCPVNQMEWADITKYYYLDVLVVDINNIPVKNAIVTIPSKNYNINYHGNITPQILTNTPINLYGELLQTPMFQSKVLTPQLINTTLTGIDGHTPLPYNNDTTLVVAHVRYDKGNSNDSTYTTSFSYDITASKDGYSTTITNIIPSTTWLRTNPDIPTNTITIQLPYVQTTCPIPICNINITQL